MKQKSFSIYRRWCSWFGNIGNAVVNADSGTRLHIRQPRRYTRLHIRQPFRQYTVTYSAVYPSNLLGKPSSRKSTMRRRFLNQIAVCTRIPFIILDIRGALWFCLLASYRALGHFSAVFFSCFSGSLLFPRRFLISPIWPSSWSSTLALPLRILSNRLPFLALCWLCSPDTALKPVDTSSLVSSLVPGALLCVGSTDSF